jgi:ABC-type Fe3+-hydroxamate transport system substrate-binding protein
MLGVAGFKNVFADKNRYPEITIEELKAAAPQYILLSSEPFPFKQKHADELAVEFPLSRVLLVDGELFSWYGSRLLKAPKYFEELFKSFSKSSG